MPSPSHRPDQFSANRIFAGREEEKQLFFDQYSSPQSANEYRILNYYGIGGQGKSALCNQFEEYLKKQVKDNHHIAWAKVDFQDVSKQQAIPALLALRYQLASTGEIRFPAFDTAFARYFSKTEAGKQLENSHPELFSQPHDILHDVADVASELDGVPGLGWMLKHINKAKQKSYLKDWMKRRGKDLLAGLDVLSDQDLAIKLPTYLGADIDDWLHGEADMGRRVTLLYDTYEALWQNKTHKKETLTDDWVRRLVAETPAVLHVILGREALTWSDDNKTEWQQELFSYKKLKQLSAAKTDEFLQAVPIKEAEIRQQIIQSANRIPFYLNLQVDHYEETQRKGKAPKIEDYGAKNTKY